MALVDFGNVPVVRPELSSVLTASPNSSRVLSTATRLILLEAKIVCLGYSSQRLKAGQRIVLPSLVACDLRCLLCRAFSTFRGALTTLLRTGLASRIIFVLRTFSRTLFTSFAARGRDRGFKRSASRGDLNASSTDIGAVQAEFDAIFSIGLPFGKFV